MSCTPVFSKEVSLTCLIDFAKAVRLGPTATTIKQGVWLTGCLMEKFVPDDSVSVQATIEFTDLESALDALETMLLFGANESDVTATSIPWASLIPLILEIIRLISKK